MDGQDLIGRAKTGSGKTLAFALPVIEGLLAEDGTGGAAALDPTAPKKRGRPPKASGAR
jgi:ATP-dependent RNA helicase DDX21